MKLFLLLLMLLSVSCVDQRSKNYSMFFFFPRSINSLSANGYKQHSDELFSKRIADTLENIQIYNLDSGQFSKSFYIRIRTPDTTSMVEYIARNADSVLLELDYLLLIRQDGDLYLISHGYSGNKTMYLLAYRNPKVYNDKIMAIATLKERLDWYPDSLNQSLINRALSLIDPNWKSLPTSFPDLSPDAVEIDTK